MKAFLRTFSVVALGFAFLSCGGPLSDDSNKAKNDRDNEKTVNEFATVVGVYTGAIRLDADGRDLPGKIVLYVDYQSDGVDNNNQGKRRPVLSAQLKLDGVGELDDMNFLAYFDANTGSVTLNQPAQGGSSSQSTATVCAVGPKDPKFTISGHILGGQFSGDASAGSRIGTVSMKRTSTDATQPVRDQYERLVSAYQKVKGTYEGAVLVNGSPLAANIVFKIEEVAIGEGVTCPLLKAQFKFKTDIGILDDTKFAVSYRESSGHVLLAAEQSGNNYTCPVGLADSKARIEGTIAAKKFTGVMNGAVTGKLNAAFLSPSTEIINDQSDRIRNAYANIEGTYGGRFVSDSGSSADKFPVKFGLYIDVDYLDPAHNLKCPILRGQYIRPDKPPGIGTILITAKFNPGTSLLTILNDGTGQCAQPGCKDLSIDDAAWNSSGFTGKMRWFRVQPGTVSVKRCTTGKDVDRDGNCLH